MGISQDLTLADELRAAEGMADGAWKQLEIIDRWKAHPIVADAIAGKRSLTQAVDQLYSAYGGDVSLLLPRRHNPEYHTLLDELVHVIPTESLRSVVRPAIHQTGEAWEYAGTKMRLPQLMTGVMYPIYTCAADYLLNPLGAGLSLGIAIAAITHGSGSFESPLTNYSFGFAVGAVSGAVIGLMTTSMLSYSYFDHARAAAQKIDDVIARTSIMSASNSQ